MIVNSIEYGIKSFEIQRVMSFKFDKLENGHYSVTDRGTGADVYRTKISMYDERHTIATFLDYIRSQRENNTIAVTFDTTEQVFGANIDYSSPVNATVINDSGAKQNTWKGYDTSIQFEFKSPTHSGVSTFPELKHSSHNFNPNYVDTRNVNFTYDSDPFINDNNADHGIFTGTFWFNDTDMRNLLEYNRSKRGEPFYINELPGFEYIFGRKRNLVFPVQVRLIEINEKYSGPNRWECRLTIVEEV